MTVWAWGDPRSRDMYKPMCPQPTIRRVQEVCEQLGFNRRTAAKWHELFTLLTELQSFPDQSGPDRCTCEDCFRASVFDDDIAWVRDYWDVEP